MPYGTIKVDTITFTAGGVDTSVSISGLVQNPTFTGNITSTGTISGNIIRGGTTVSGATVTGTAGQFGTLTGNTAGFTTVTGTTVTGTTANFTTLSGTTATITSGVFASGTAAAPSVSVGTTTNGLFSSGANEVAISTGGSGRLFIDSSGRVGIGTSPSETLHINGNAIVKDRLLLQRLQSSDNLSVLTFSDTLSGSKGNNLSLGNPGGFDLLFHTGGVEKARITSTGALNFVGAGTAGVTQAVSFNGSAPVNSLVIDSSGRLGVGTSSPSDVLHVEGVIRTSSGGSNAQFANNYLRSNQAGTFYFDQNSGSQDFAFRVSNVTNLDTTAMTIKSSGRVGIGTSSPNHRLDISGGVGSGTSTFGVAANLNGGYGAANSNHGLSFSINSNNPSAGIYVTDANGAGSNLRFTTASSYSSPTQTVAMTIDSSQRVGIGTTSPVGKLHIGGVSAVTDTAIYIPTGGIQGDNGGVFEIANVGNTTSELKLNTRGTLTFYRTTSGALGGGSEMARFDSSGRLLVGTSTDRFSTKLLVEGTDGTGGATFARNSNDAGPPYSLFIKSRGTTVGSNTAVQSGDTLGFIGFYGTDGTSPISGASIQAQVDGTPGTNDMPGRLVFSTTADGASSPTERMRINQSGTIGSFATSLDANIYLSNAATAGVSTPLLRGRYGATGMYGGTDSIYIWSNGNVQNTNNSYTAISDAKLKENIVDANSQWNDIKALQVRNYNLKEGQTHKQIGLIAQEVEPISPGLVYESPDRDAEGNDLGTVTKSVNYSVLYMKAVKALQEAMLRIEDLEARLNAANL